MREVLVIVAALSIQDPRERPVDNSTQADQAHARFAVPGTDFGSYLTLWASRVRPRTRARPSAPWL